ncbi:hypothetical protein DICVIV_06652 [Dictyocaulus viviparus]|uniref:C2H2-type domain-containing protein n=1 Tax=Dictyocaulus viviparus TaxID=29172 RepID=A0A0D8XY25_DICVI|nr:hypothetical protein DICVIV_06652 [Dictyocaulus viviparus]
MPSSHQMTSQNVLGPPPALYNTLLGGPIHDCLVSVNGTEPIAGNEDRLRRASPLFASLLSENEFQNTRCLQLQLTTTNAELVFGKAMNFLNTGDFEMNGCLTEQMLAIADECQILSLQEKAREFLATPQLQAASELSSIASTSHLPSPVPIFSPIPNPFLLLSLQSQLHASNFLQMVMFHLNMTNQSHGLNDERFHKKRRTTSEVRESRKTHSIENDGLFDNLGDVIIPSTDKEVSYHVTIYHRNPPIKCDLPGCHFTTREARYIHFHKYYRHGVALPESIDQGTRRCPHCRHVSKSPAMLEKHIRRHQIVENTSRDINLYSVSPELVVVDSTVTEKKRRRRDTTLSMETSIDDSTKNDELTKPRALTL